jgi:hypothetical protein
LTEFRNKYVGYKMWLNGVRDTSSKLVDSLPHPSPREVDSITRAWTQVQPTVTAWRGETTWADKQIETISGLKKRDSIDEQVVKDVRSTKKKLQSALDKSDVLQAVITDWARTQRERKTIDARLANVVQTTFVEKWLDLEVALRDLMLGAEAAYERYPEEADARSTESEITKTVRAQAPARPAAKP